jgi:hypothetical protein
MNKKKAIAWMGSLLLLGVGIAFSASNPQKAARNSFQNSVKSDVKPGPFFVDENGDGICDFARGGNPNWSEQKERHGYQRRNENNASSDQSQNRFSHRKENTWNRQSSRQNRENFGNGICDGSGPKGRGQKKGNGQG